MKAEKNKSLVVLQNENKGAWMAPMMVYGNMEEMPCLKCVFAGSFQKRL
jgi:hypothetical protein